MLIVPSTVCLWVVEVLNSAQTWPQDADVDEIPDTVQLVDDNSVLLESPMEHESALEVELHEIVKGSSPVEFMHKMSESLGLYAQAFEHFESFGTEMWTGKPIASIDADISPQCQRYLLYNLDNPFRNRHGFG